MIPRYQDPQVDSLWADDHTYRLWLQIEQAVLRAQVEQGIVEPEPGGKTLAWLDQVHIDDGAAGEIRAIERNITRHDVAAFLSWLRHDGPGHEPAPYGGSYIHFGLTSSDLVDTAQGLRFKWLSAPLIQETNALAGRVHDVVQTQMRTPLVGRTHGQPAEVTSLGMRAAHWQANMDTALVALLHASRSLRQAKLSGPVGTYAHNPRSIEDAAAKSLGLLPLEWGASQIAPRAKLAEWANACVVFAASCSKIATDLRLMNLLGQVSWNQQGGQVGSSAMAHKNNPIVAEQICGLAIAVRGFASMLQPLDLWLERDISHSSVERIAVPDLWHLVFRLIRQTTWLLDEMVVNHDMLRLDLEVHPEVWNHRTTLDLIRMGVPVEDARRLVVEEPPVPVENPDFSWFVRNAT